MPIPVPAAAQRLRYGVPNRSNRQLELLVDRGLLFSGAAGTLEHHAQAAAMYPVNKELDILRWAPIQRAP
jgi:hypothetical protein